MRPEPLHALCDVARQRPGGQSRYRCHQVTGEGQAAGVNPALTLYYAKVAVIHLNSEFQTHE